jgi:hypothetical protein
VCEALLFFAVRNDTGKNIIKEANNLIMNIISPTRQQTSPHRIPSNTILSRCRIVHCKKLPYDVYIGRPSKWGNPFSHKHGTLAEYKVASRREAIEAFRDWITKGEGRYLLTQLHELAGKTLGCWCKPDACHGDILAELVLQYY